MQIKSSLGPADEVAQSPLLRAHELLGSLVGTAEVLLRSGRKPHGGVRIGPQQLQPERGPYQSCLVPPTLAGTPAAGTQRMPPRPLGRRLRRPLIGSCLSDGHQNNYALFHFIHTNPQSGFHGYVPPSGRKAWLSA